MKARVWKCNVVVMPGRLEWIFVNVPEKQKLHSVQRKQKSSKFQRELGLEDTIAPKVLQNVVLPSSENFFLKKLSSELLDVLLSSLQIHFCGGFNIFTTEDTIFLHFQ